MKGEVLTELRTEQNRIYAERDGVLLAEITFPETAEGVFCIDHTFVDASLRGQGAAGQLVRAAVEAIHAKGGTVTATCSYALGWLQKHNIQQ